MRYFIILLIIFSSFRVSSAQELAPEKDPKAIIDEIDRKMREIEQQFAKASLEPDDVRTIIEQLQSYAQGDQERLPRLLREFLLNNPDLLSKLQNPDATDEELLRAEDEIRRLFATNEDGIEKLLKDNPKMLQKLLEDDTLLGESLKNHLSSENNLERLFDQTLDNMRSTEKDIEDLIDLAEEMQEQMNQQAQNQGQNQLNQPDQKDQNSQKDRETDNDQVEKPEEGDGADQNYPNNESQNGRRLPDGKLDQEAWDLMMPQSERERNTNPDTQKPPQGWEAEAARYFRLLAEQARKERERQRRIEEHQKKNE